MHGAKPRIVIIGGGIAGLAAANALLRNNFSVTILEAKDRLGGRMHTILDGTTPIELGAEFLHGENKAVRSLIEAAGLTTQEVSDSHQLLEDGKLKRVKIWEKIAEIINRIDPHGPDASFNNFLKTQNLSEAEHRMAIGFVEGFHAAHIDRIGIHALLRGEYSAEQMEGDSQGRVTQGYSALISFLEREIRAHGGEIITGAQVKTIRWRLGHADIHFHHGHESKQIEAKSVLVTVSLGVLKSKAIEFDPPLTEKSEAIEQLQFGNVVKVILLYRKPWWPESLGFAQSLAEPIPTWWTDPRGNILCGWTGGPKADALVDHSPDQLQKLALEVLGRIFPDATKSIQEELVAFHSHNWAHDPHVRGAYSYIPVNGLDLPKLLAAPVRGTLFFAGEATVSDAQMGTVFGGYESGLRAARECIVQLS